ncbi:MAG: hypothetical protein Fur0016_05810 [Anaerolineales bacterium]
MSGIAGFYNTAVSQLQDEAEIILRRRTDSIRHRGPDDWGVGTMPGTVLGWGFAAWPCAIFRPAGL